MAAGLLATLIIGALALLVTWAMVRIVLGGDDPREQ